MIAYRFCCVLIVTGSHQNARTKRLAFCQYSRFTLKDITKTDVATIVFEEVKVICKDWPCFTCDGIMVSTLMSSSAYLEQLVTRKKIYIL